MALGQTRNSLNIRYPLRHSIPCQWRCSSRNVKMKKWFVCCILSQILLCELHMHLHIHTKIWLHSSQCVKLKVECEILMKCQLPCHNQVWVIKSHIRRFCMLIQKGVLFSSLDRLHVRIQINNSIMIAFLFYLPHNFIDFFFHITFRIF